MEFRKGQLIECAELIEKLEAKAALANQLAEAVLNCSTSCRPCQPGDWSTVHYDAEDHKRMRILARKVKEAV